MSHQTTWRIRPKIVTFIRVHQGRGGNIPKYLSAVARVHNPKNTLTDRSVRRQTAAGIRTHDAKIITRASAGMVVAHQIVDADKSPATSRSAQAPVRTTTGRVTELRTVGRLLSEVSRVQGSFEEPQVSRPENGLGASVHLHLLQNALDESPHHPRTQLQSPLDLL
jgi:hypothetical protein